MKAIVNERYGSPDVLALKDVAKPTPEPNQVLVKIEAAAVNAYDWHMLRADPFLVRLMGGGFLKPKYTIRGADIAGHVEAVGSDVTQFRPGDAVFGDLASSGGGGFAEYAVARESMVAPKPATLSFEEAAAVPMAAVTALQGLRDRGQLQAGQSVLIYGASGGVGTFAVQIAKAFGAEVTAVCSTAKVEMVRQLGADHVIDYTQEDFSQHDRQYDLILGVNGYHPLSVYKRALRPGGTYIMIGGTNAQIFQGMLAPLYSFNSDKTFAILSARPNQKDLMVLTELIEAGKVTPVIDRCYPLAETAAAIRYVEKGHAKGKVIITMT